MELYYKDLISKDTSLEKLVDDLTLLVQGADEFADAAGASLHPHKREELHSLLQRFRARCRHAQEHARASALAIDKLLRQYPYTVAGIALSLGLFGGLLINRARGKRTRPAKESFSACPVCGQKPR